MIDPKRFKNDLFSINEASFDKLAIEVFHFQWTQNQIYRDYCNLLGVNPKDVREITNIPFLPITFFKSQVIKSGTWKEGKVFKSSGTTGERSQHFVLDESFYHRGAAAAFQQHFGNTEDLQILALLPSYMEQGDSSLISMVNHFIDRSGHNGGFFMKNYDDLVKRITDTQAPKILFGVSYALLDFIAARGPFDGDGSLTVIETGGMKGRREEITRLELHRQLKEGFRVSAIYSEYGMTELFSQAYGKYGLFSFPKWAKAMIRDINDPFHYMEKGTTGAINIIDLANIHTISFVETEDLGRMDENGQFEVLGRMDNTDIRGCNLLI